MVLIDIPENPLPSGAIVHTVEVDGLFLRVVRWEAPQPQCARGTVAVLPGRSEFVEKYAEVVRDLLARDFAVVVVDWRGQGASSRLLANPRKGHVGHFDDYRADLNAVIAQVLVPHGPKPWFALGHSMAGAIVLDHAARGASPFARIVLSAPMIDLAGLRVVRAVRAIVATAARTGLAGAYVPGGSDQSWMARPFAGNGLTSDADRFAAFNALARRAPDLVLGAPTYGWLHAAFGVMRAIGQAGFAQRVAVPTLVVACGVDRVVATPAAERLAARLKLGRCIVIGEALHEVLMERDPLRQQFWAAFDAFVPGS